MGKIVFQILISAIEVKPQSCHGACLESERGIQLLVGGIQLRVCLTVWRKGFQCAEVVRTSSSRGTGIERVAIREGVLGGYVGGCLDFLAEPEGKIYMRTKADLPLVVLVEE